ncbi:MAG: DUF1569 domain-containing protein [Chitinophagales bacterium]|nr:DUF1569 domain-containing protein [Chitinophagales bacterium]
MKSIYEQQTTDDLLNRINQLNNTSQASWGKMNAAQMLAHCNATYKVLNDNYPKPNAIKKLFLKLFVKNIVVSDKPYKKNSPTSPDFIISDEREFEKEKTNLIQNIITTQKLGTSYFEGKASPGFGVLTAKEWSNLFYKHLDHHLAQFGV